MPLLQVTCACGTRCREELYRPSADRSLDPGWQSQADYLCPTCNRLAAQFQWRREGSAFRRRIFWAGPPGRAEGVGCLAGIVEGAS
ncbi:hypothetical protein [Caldinitratiruptor microaerophilus]|uniref:Uncharacterized protein n=1 Tax=Caldinitratiruptor microaerophilus TaxID=671077 RepID=A0AA35CPD4_9FIRM|nr:hypothetical protein [Caldinitratiruptor microaerophilus]BDG61255.1 hypothetical protein caldi_23450 [Caldinitratiruptor microaerophilus]